MIGAQSLSCNPVYGIIAMAVGAACVAFATAEAQESPGYGNWLKDAVGMSDEVYNGVMVAVNIAAVAINIVGVKQCFKEGTLVACLNENGEEIQRPIESIALGTLVLAYDEETGEQAYKKVVRLFRNETYEWYHIFVNDEEIVCTGGHPFYSTKYDKFVAAKDLETDDKLLFSNGEYGIINQIEVEVLSKPQTTYNFEVEDYHTYYVGENEVLVHNKCDKKINDAKKKVLSNEDVTLDTKDQALKLVNEKFADYPQEMAQARSAKGWHFDSHPINGSVGNIDHINLYNKKLHIRVHITWRT